VPKWKREKMQHKKEIAKEKAAMSVGADGAVSEEDLLIEAMPEDSIVERAKKRIAKKKRAEKRIKAAQEELAALGGPLTPGGDGMMDI
jgi:hypothetical protein